MIRKIVLKFMGCVAGCGSTFRFVVGFNLVLQTPQILSSIKFLVQHLGQFVYRLSMFLIIEGLAGIPSIG